MFSYQDFKNKSLLEIPTHIEWTAHSWPRPSAQTQPQPAGKGLVPCFLEEQGKWGFVINKVSVLPGLTD